uniref:Uncharacterized protein n=1 Tax=Astyanax mexicanus TaxID=7994 RepID=A0A8B9H9P6_ASTMX
MKRNGSRGCVTRKNRFGSRERDWLKGDAQRGCVCLCGASEPQAPVPGPQTTSTAQPDLKLCPSLDLTYAFVVAELLRNPRSNIPKSSIYLA